MTFLAGGLSKRRLPWQQPLQGKQTSRFVYSEKELVAALGDFTSSRTAGELPSVGKTIVVCGTIPLSKTVELTSALSGINITADGQGYLLAQGAFPIFTALERVSVRISNIIGAGASVTGFVYVADDASVEGDIEFCRYEGGGAFLDFETTTGLKNTFYGRVVHNIISATDGIVLRGSTTQFCGNDMLDTGEVSVLGLSMPSTFLGTVISHNVNLPNIVIGAAAERCVITGNYCKGNDITTSASNGNNVIVGNAHVGTVTSHGTDAVANNTA